MKLRKLLRAYERGEVPASAILGDVEWDKVAETVRKRWTLPGDVETEDIAQEMRLGAWHALAAYQAGLSRLEDFVLFRAHASARKFVDKARGANGLKGDELRKGRFFQNMSDFGASRAANAIMSTSKNHTTSFKMSSGGGDHVVTEDDWPAPPQDDPIGPLRTLARKLGRMTDARASAVVVFMQHADSKKAARILILSRSFRRLTGITTEKDARKFVLESARRAAASP